MLNELCTAVMEDGRFKHYGLTYEEIYQTEWNYTSWCINHGSQKSQPWLKRAQSYFVLRQLIFARW